MNKEIFDIMKKKLNNGMPLWEVLDNAKSELKYIPRPAKPTFKMAKKDPTSEEALQYANEVKEYEIEMNTYKKLQEKASEHNIQIYQAIEEFIKQQSGFYNIPEKYQSKVWSFCYEKGHSSEYYEVYNYLCQLAEIFEGN